MTPLEVVLTAVLGFILVIIVPLTVLFLSVQHKKEELYDVANKYVKKGQIVFFGDSLTGFYPVQDFFDDVTVYNRGIANDRTTDLLRRMQNVYDIAPRKLFLQIGTNDLGMGKKPQNVIDNIAKIIAILQEKVPNVQIYVISLYPVNRHKQFISFISCQFRNNKKIIETNKLLKKFCAEKQLPFIDAYPSLTDCKGDLKVEYSVEGLHLNALGYDVMTGILKEYVI